MTGKTRIADKVVTHVINKAAASVPGVERISSSWADIGNRSYPRCEIQLDHAAGLVHIDSYLSVTWPSPVSDVASKVQRTIATWVSATTGLRPTQVNVTVEQTSPSTQRVTPEEVAASPIAPSLAEIRLLHQTVATAPVISPAREVTAPRVTPGVTIHSIEAPVLPPLIDVHTRPARALAAIVTAEPAPLTPVQVPPPAALAAVVTQRERPLRPITVAEKPVYGVRAPRAVQPVSVRAPRAKRLASVYLPRQTRLRPISFSSQRVTSVKVPNPPRLAQINTMPERRLREIHVRELPVRSVQAPPPKRLAAVRMPERPLKLVVATPLPVRSIDAEIYEERSARVH